jgi:hypothetical protein
MNLNNFHEFENIFEYTKRCSQIFTKSKNVYELKNKEKTQWKMNQMDGS